MLGCVSSYQMSWVVYWTPTMQKPSPRTQELDFHLYPCSLPYTGYICTYKRVNTQWFIYSPVTTNSILASNDYWSIIQWLLLSMVVTYAAMQAEWICTMKLSRRLDSLKLHIRYTLVDSLHVYWLSSAKFSLKYHEEEAC